MRTRRLVVAVVLAAGITVAILAAVELLRGPTSGDGLQPGDFVSVEVPSLPLYDAIGGAGLDSTVRSGERLLLVGGPQGVGELLWYRVEHFGRSGSTPYAIARFAWVVVPIGEPWLAEYEPDCPDQVGPVDVAAITSLNPAEALHCFGDAPLTLGPIIARLESQEIFEVSAPEWLAAQPELQVYGRNGWDSNDGAIGGHFAPGGADIPPGVWLEITGHFDDPASLTCRRTPTHPHVGPIEANDAILWCKQQLVIDRFANVVAPDPTPAPPVMPGTWSELPPAPIAPRSGHSGVWTGSEMIVWGGTILESEAPSEVVFAQVNDGAAFDPATQRWRSIAPAPIPARSQHAAIWTGKEMLVWGGYSDEGGLLVGGGRYDPLTDTWAEIPPAPLPATSTESFARATWDGGRLLAWIGVEVAAFDPATSAWERLPDIPARTVESVALAGGDGQLFALVFPPGISARVQAFTYDADWSAMPDPPLSALDADRDPVWTGSNLLLFSYSGYEPLDDSLPRDRLYAARFDPAAGAWSIDVSPHYFMWSPHLWTGESVFFTAGFGAFHDSKRLWEAIPEMDVLPNEAFASAWTGEALLIWGGSRGESFRPIEDGWAFTPE